MRGDDATTAAHTRACRTFDLLAGDAAEPAADAVATAGESGTYDALKLRALLGPEADAASKAGLVDGLGDADDAAFRDLPRAAAAATPPVGRSFVFADPIVTALQKTTAAEVAARM